MKSEEWLGKRGSRDNTYEGTFGAAGWGYKAQQVLGQARTSRASRACCSAPPQPHRLLQHTLALLLHTVRGSVCMHVCCGVVHARSHTCARWQAH